MATAKKKTVNKQQHHGKSKDELLASLVTTQSELLETRRTHASRELTNTAKVHQLRKEIARIKTLLNDPLSSKEKA